MIALATGRAALREALRLKPDYADSYVEAARLDLVEAAWAARGGRSAGAILLVHSLMLNRRGTSRIISAWYCNRCHNNSP